MGILSVAKRLIFGREKIGNTPVVNLVMPVGRAGGAAVSVAKGAGNVVKSLWEGVKGFTEKKTINPLADIKLSGSVLDKAGQLAKGVGGLIAKGAGVGTLGFGAYEIGKYAVTGNVPSKEQAITDARKIIGGATSIKLGSLLGAGGILKGTQEVTGKNVRDIFLKAVGLGQSKAEDLSGLYTNSTNKLKDITEDLPQNPTINITNNYPEIPQLPAQTMPQILTFETPQAPNVSPTYAPSFSLSGSAGIGENLPLMLALLAGGVGVGGYMLGRRKKKKYKKRKRHKK